MQESLDRLEDENARVRETLARFELSNSARLEREREARDELPELREKLLKARSTKAYDAAFADPEPLVTVRIPAWRKTEELVDVAIASVLRQTYERFEIVVVNDGPNEVTRDAITKLGDSRITYVEFPEQNRYPDDTHLRWMVAGTPGMNLGAERAKGTWIAPLDDDDEFSADHLEKLVSLALRERAELAYGALLQKHLTWKTEQIIWSDPPAVSQFSMMGTIYLKAIDFFRYDEQSWKVEEPADWNLIRRMSAAGVRMSSTKDVVGTMYSVSYASKE
jgi:glycosyltransferase involved in cell wall biosynthesis